MDPPLASMTMEMEWVLGFGFGFEGGKCPFSQPPVDSSSLVGHHQSGNLMVSFMLHLE